MSSVHGLNLRETLSSWYKKITSPSSWFSRSNRVSSKTAEKSQTPAQTIPTKPPTKSTNRDRSSGSHSQHSLSKPQRLEISTNVRPSFADEITASPVEMISHGASTSSHPKGTSSRSGKTQDEYSCESITALPEEK